MIWKRLKLALALLVFASAWALLGALTTFNRTGGNVWIGLAAGTGFGLLFGLAVAGNPAWKCWD